MTIERKTQRLLFKSVLITFYKKKHRKKMTRFRPSGNKTPKALMACIGFLWQKWGYSIKMERIATQSLTFYKIFFLEDRV